MKFNIFVIIFIVLFVSACATAPQQPISLNKEALLDGNRMGIVMDKMPKPALDLPGASCLLCIATAMAANSTLSTQVKTFSSEELVSLPAEVKGILKGAGKEVLLIEEELEIKDLPGVENWVENKPRKDFSVLAKSNDVGQLLVIDVNHHGATRPYSAYFPTGGPEASISGAAYLIDMRSNTYLWYLPISIFRGVDAEAWDEPPAYPGVTNSYYQVVEEFRDAILEAIKKQVVN